MSNTVDVIVLLVLLMGAAIGFKKGVFKSAVTFIGSILVIVLAFSLKNPVSKLLYSFLPFFNFAGDFEGLTVLNIVIYEAVAFLLVYVVLMAILQILIKVTGIFEKILNFTIILGIPSKLMGAVFGFFETYLFVFIALFLLSQIPATNEILTNAKLANQIVESSPVLSGTVDDYYKSFQEIVSIKDQNINNKEEYNRESLDILLKYDVVKVDAVETLLKNGKLKIENADSVLNKYR